MSADAPPTLPTPDALNQLDRDAFLHVCNTLFETAPPLADRLFASRPFPSLEALIDFAERVTFEMAGDEQLQVVNAHPELGAPAKNLSYLSRREQRAAPEAELTAEERAVLETLARLNAEYRERFGFKFILFVNGRTRAQVVEVLRERMHNERAAELHTAIRDMMSIARDRLRKLRANL